MKKLTTIITASIAGAALVLGAATAASAYPVGQYATVSVKQSGNVAGERIAVGMTNVEPGVNVLYLVGGNIITKAAGDVVTSFQAPSRAGEYLLTGRVLGGSEQGRLSNVKFTVGKIVKSITTKAKAATVKKGAKATVSGTAVTAPKSTGYVVIQVQVRTSKTGYKTIKTIRTDSDGTYDYSFKLAKGIYAVRTVSGDAQFSPATSGSTQVTFK